MKYIRFVMSRGDEITVSMDKAERLLNSPDQLVKITNEKGEWTGEVLNKAHIVSSRRDFMREKEKIVDSEYNSESELPPGRPIAVDMEKFRPEFMRKPYKEND